MASTRTIDCATETSRIGSEITTANASITRYCEPNQLALTTLGLVLPLISPPTFWRNHWPAADTAAVKLRSALSPAADTTPVAAPLRALPTERPAPAPAGLALRVRRPAPTGGPGRSSPGASGPVSAHDAGA